MRTAPSFREQIRSPYYWLTLIFLVGGALLSGIVGPVAFVAYIPAVVVMWLDVRRRRNPPVTHR
jgi:hypothetical protein